MQSVKTKSTGLGRQHKSAKSLRWVETSVNQNLNDNETLFFRVLSSTVFGLLTILSGCGAT